MTETELTARLRGVLWPLLSRDVRGIAPVPALVAISGVDPDRIAAALLPVVREIADQRAAEELRAAAESQDCWCEIGDDYGVTCRRHGEMADDLRARAAALDGPDA